MIRDLAIIEACEGASLSAVFLFKFQWSFPMQLDPTNDVHADAMADLEIEADNNEGESEDDPCEGCEGAYDEGACYGCSATEEDLDHDNEGQPDEYTEWQDVFGGDDWDQGQYDE
jgi:hypothetical protein